MITFVEVNIYAHDLFCSQQLLAQEFGFTLSEACSILWQFSGNREAARYWIMTDHLLRGLLRTDVLIFVSYEWINLSARYHFPKSE